MNDRELHLLMRAKRQIERESAMKSFLVFGVFFTAALRFLDVELPFLYRVLFTVMFICLILTSDMFASIGLVSKQELVKLIEDNIHRDPEALTRYTGLRNKA